MYYAKVLKQDVPRAVELLSDILLNSTFSPARAATPTAPRLRALMRLFSPGLRAQRSGRTPPPPPPPARHRCRCARQPPRPAAPSAKGGT